MNLTKLDNVTGLNCHIYGDLSHSISVAKKYFDTSLEQISD
ncbi:hypothetical protein ACFSKU_01035 [Pontibacter silvestris]|uniref:Uncharacterized protein n=1 Tax=Pontibacter silvestris TaxID=2305183 RepID=A0ABW4WTA3_9BACT